MNNNQPERPVTVNTDITTTSQADFSATEITLEAITEAGKQFLASIFGVGAISITLPKSKAIDFARFAEQKGIQVAA